MSRRRDYKQLTPKELRFVDEYLIDLNGAAAARRAGFSAKSATVTASKLLLNRNVAAAIDAAKQQRAQAAGIDAEWVLREAVALYQRCISEIKPALHPKTRRQLRDDAGNPLFTFNASVAARALELVGKHVTVGAFEERVRVEGPSIVELLQQGRLRVGQSPVIEVPSEPVALPAPPRKPRLPLPAEGATLVRVTK